MTDAVEIHETSSATVEVREAVVNGTAGGGDVSQQDLDDAVAALEALIDGKLDADAGLGGVLSGNAPNPGFAVNMATQAELDDEASARQTGDATTLSTAEAYVDAAVSTLLGGAPAAALDTIAELATAMEDEQDATAALTSAIAGKLDSSSPKLAPDPTLLPDDDFIVVASGLYVARTPGQVRTALSLVPGTDVQAFSSVLATYAGITPTSIAQTILAAANAAAVRTAIGLGTAAQSATGDFQPADSDLTAIAALSTTTYGRSLLAAADAAAVFTILGYTPSPYGSVTIAHMVPPTKAGTFRPLPDTAANYLGNTNNSASGDYIEWPNVPLGGTYTISFAHHQFANGGQWRVSIDGTNVGSTIEGYAGSTGAVMNTDASIAITAGLHTVRITCTGKNASSAGYGLRLLGFGFARTA